MTVSTADPRQTLLAAPMSAYQKAAVALTICLFMLDGFDVIAITFAAPAIRTAWHISQAKMGLVLASALLGMAAGSLLIAPLADTVGRRRMVLFSLGLMIVGDTWCANTGDVTALIWARAFTGLGIGAMIAVINSLSAEYSNARNRDFCVTLMSAGFPIGGMIGGLVAAFLLPNYGWRAVFITGAAVGLLMLALVAILLPEPVAPMIARPRADTLARVNLYLRRCGLNTVTALPPPPPEARSAPLSALFGPGMGATTVWITAIYFLHVITLFFVQSWAPSLVVSEGFHPAQAALIALWVNVGGVAGGLLLGANSMRLGLKPLVMAAMIGGGVVTAAFGAIPPNFLMLAAGSASMGFFLQGGMMGLYAAVARTFPAHMRVSGMGFVVGLGRIGSALGPVLAGQLLAGGLTRAGVALAMAIPTVAAALLLLKFPLKTPDTP